MCSVSPALSELQMKMLQMMVISNLGGSLAVLPQHRQLMRIACQRMDGIGDFSRTLSIMRLSLVCGRLTRSHW